MDILKELKNDVVNCPEASYYYNIEQQVHEISKLLRAIRIKRGMSQIQIAKKTGLSKQMISKIESYNGNPTLTTLIKYCDCVGINLVKLLENDLI